MELNEVERALDDAVRRGDVEAYQRVLGGATLLLPVSSAAAAGREPVRWATAVHGGRTYVLAFTSPGALRIGVGDDTASYREAPFADVAHAWPDPDAWLAVDLGLPLQALLDPAMVARAAVLGEVAAQPVEAALRIAVRSGEESAYAAALLGAELVLPLRPDGSWSRDVTDPLFAWWLIEETVLAYTSIPRLRADLGGSVDWLVIDFGELARAWPDPGWALSVNPGSPVGGLVSGAAMRGLGRWAGVALDAAQGAAAAARQDPSLSPDEAETAAHRAARDAVARLLRG